MNQNKEKFSRLDAGRVQSEVQGSVPTWPPSVPPTPPWRQNPDLGPTHNYRNTRVCGRSRLGGRLVHCRPRSPVAPLCRPDLRRPSERPGAGGPKPGVWQSGRGRTGQHRSRFPASAAEFACNDVPCFSPPDPSAPGLAVLMVEPDSKGREAVWHSWGGGLAFWRTQLRALEQSCNLPGPPSGAGSNT